MRLHYDQKAGIFYNPLSSTGRTFSGEEVADLIEESIGYPTTFLQPDNRVIGFKVLLDGEFPDGINISWLSWEIDLACNLNVEPDISFFPSVRNIGSYWFHFVYLQRIDKTP